jgi:predicted PurR-regulated permease PerM
MAHQLEQMVTEHWWRLALVGAAALVLGFAAVAALWLLARTLVLLILGITLAAAVSPLVSWLERWLPRVVAVVLIYLIGLLLVLAAGAIILQPLVNQAQQFSDRLPDVIQRLEELFNRQNGLTDRNLFDTLSSQVGNVGSYLVSLPVAIVSGAVEILFTVIISIYWLIAAPKMRDLILSLFPEDQGERIYEVLYEMGRSMGGFVRGTALDGLAVGILTYVGLLVIGVDYALVLGLLGGMLEVIPNLGPVIATIPTVAVAWFQSPTKGLIALAFMIVLQQLENHLLLPNIMRSQTEISPLLTILALFTGGALGGFIGALAAIPLAAALRVFVLRVVAPAVRRQTGAALEQAQESS